MKKIFILGVFFLSFLITFFMYSPELLAGQEYAEKKITTEQTVSGLETSVEVKIVECIGQGSNLANLLLLQRQLLRKPR